jgi:hypothetical protein
MTNNKQQTAVEWLIEKCACADLRPELWEIIKQQAKEMYQDEIEAAIIKDCAERSTFEASKYAEGYKQGYNRALELSKWAISNLIPPYYEQG